MNIEYVADAIWDAMERKEPVPDLLESLPESEAWSVQLAILRKAVSQGDMHAGWKIERQLGQELDGSRPRFNFLLRSRHLRSGASLALNPMKVLQVDATFCLVLGEPLRGPNINTDQARRAIAFVEPSLEISEAAAGQAVTARGITHKSNPSFFITGAASPHDSRLKLSSTRIAVEVNGKSRAVWRGSEDGAGAAGPIEALAWLANKLAGCGVAMPPGMRIMVGGFADSVRVEPGDKIAAKFEPFGPVKACLD